MICIFTSVQSQCTCSLLPDNDLHPYLQTLHERYLITHLAYPFARLQLMAMNFQPGSIFKVWCVRMVQTLAPMRLMLDSHKTFSPRSHTDTLPPQTHAHTHTHTHTHKHIAYIHPINAHTYMRYCPYIILRVWNKCAQYKNKGCDSCFICTSSSAYSRMKVHKINSCHTSFQQCFFF